MAIRATSRVFMRIVAARGSRSQTMSAIVYDKLTWLRNHCYAEPPGCKKRHKLICNGPPLRQCSPFVRPFTRIVADRINPREIIRRVSYRAQARTNRRGHCGNVTIKATTTF